MKKIVFSLIILGFVIQGYSQEIKTEELSEVVISATNYKYLSATGLENADTDIALLEQKVASYDLKKSDFYNDEYDSYFVTFYIPEGKILAAYDKEGTILRTIERFKNVVLPKEVQIKIAEQYPNWVIEKDIYLVSYHDKGGINKKYKIRLKKGDKRKRIKCDPEGNFL